MTDVVRVAQVFKEFVSPVERVQVLRGVDLTVSVGEAVVITGESGSGKSTLLSLVGALDRPTAGSVWIGDSDLSLLDEDQLAAIRRRVGFVFQFHHLLRDFTALENVTLPALLDGTGRAAAVRRGRELLAAVGMQDKAGRLPGELSGGERQRVAVARALANDPALVLADEPTGNLDEGNSGTVAEILFQVAAGLGKALLVVTHDAHLRQRGARRLRLEHGVLNPHEEPG